jgi:predicted RNase H-like HicB family nuclease
MKELLKEFLVVFEQAEDGGWGAHSPDVEGVFAVAASREEVEALMAEAITAHLEFLRKEGQVIPEPRSEAGRVAARVPA